MFVVNVVCCQVEVSATSWSLVQRSPTDCDASLCVIKKPQEWGGHGPRWAAAPQERNKQNNVKFYVCASVGMLIKWNYEMHGATMKINIIVLCHVTPHWGYYVDIEFYSKNVALKWPCKITLFGEVRDCNTDWTIGTSRSCLLLLFLCPFVC